MRDKSILIPGDVRQSLARLLRDKASELEYTSEDARRMTHSPCEETFARWAHIASTYRDLAHSLERGA
jgi:hypothetical protein